MSVRSLCGVLLLASASAQTFVVDVNKEALAITEAPGGDCVLPTIETIADGSYPVSRGLYIYVNNEKLGSNPALAPFVTYYLGDAYTESVTRAFGESGYVPLPGDLKGATDAAFASAG